MTLSSSAKGILLYAGSNPDKFKKKKKKRQIEHLVRFKAHSDTPMVRLPTVAVPFSISRSSVAVQNTAGVYIYIYK